MGLRKITGDLHTGEVSHPPKNNNVVNSIVTHKEIDLSNDVIAGGYKIDLPLPSFHSGTAAAT